MNRPTFLSWAALALLVGASGCTQLFAKRAIEQFALGLEHQDLDQLRANASETFEQKALRTDDSGEGLSLLKVPTGKVEVVAVEDLGDGQSRALVKVGDKDNAQDVEYRLTRDGKSSRWVVDDVIMQQNSGRGQIVERSVSDQMDLVLSCRELLLSWKSGDRSRILAHCSPELGKELEQLPASWLTKLSGEIADPKRQGIFKPEARLTGQNAFVVVPHPEGSLFLQMSHSSGNWLLTDMALEPTSKDSTGIRNLKKMVRALNQSHTFLASYGAEDMDALRSASSPAFFQKCLASADLSDVSLPIATLLAQPYEAKQFTDGSESVKRVELVLRDQSQTFMLSLREETIKQPEGEPELTDFRVEEVTVFSREGQDVRRMSAMFLSRAMVNVYLDGLRNRDVKRLREVSSANFNDRVWNRPEAVNFSIMAEPAIPDGAAQVIATAYRGEVSEVTIAVGETPMTFLLNSSRGWVVVDDVLLPAHDRPTSLKANLELLLPIQAFAAALNKRDLPSLIRCSGDGLDGMVWRQLRDVPESARQLVRPLLSEVLSISEQDGRILVVTSDGQTEGHILLAREGTHFVVHDVGLVPQNKSAASVDLLASLRGMIANGEIGMAAQRNPLVQQADAPAMQPAADEFSVQQAAYEVSAPETQPIRYSPAGASLSEPISTAPARLEPITPAGGARW